MRTGSCVSRLLAATGLAAALLPAPAALAQSALGDGTALDRNLQRGSMGRNTPVRDVAAEIRYQNAIVTGNAPGGLSFRGNVGYTAPNDFRDRLGSNDIFPFIRETALPSAGATSNLPTGAILPFQNAVPGFLTSAGNQPLYVQRSGAGTSVAEVGMLPSAAGLTEQRALRPVIVGAARTADGRDVALAASPLLGLRTITAPSVTPTGATGAAPVSPGEAAKGAPRTITDPGSAPGGPATLAPTHTPPPASIGEPADTSGARLERQQWTFTGLEMVARGVRTPRTPAPGSPQTVTLQAPTTIVTSQQRSDAYRDVMDRLREELAADLRTDQRMTTDAQAERPAGVVTTVEADLAARLDRLRRQLTGEPEPTAPEAPLAPQQPEAEQRPANGEKGEQAAAPVTPDVRPPDVRPQVPGMPTRTPEREREWEKEVRRQAGLQDPIAAALDPRTVEALKRSRTTVRDLRTPSVADNLVYAENMAAGQAFLRDGRYFDAEERFVRAAGAIPGDTMASVGRIHAQIGAGLYMSASMNLRTLLTVHPELVATRYASELLPAPQRWASIRGQLQSRAGGEDPGAARAASLLLAYLGYQMGDREATNAGLEALRDTAELDVPTEAAFVELLTQVWRDAPPPAAPAPAGDETK